MRTDPRRLNTLLVKESDSTPIDFNLQGRLQIGEQLPPLEQQGNAGDALGTYLKRKARRYGSNYDKTLIMLVRY